VKNKGNHQCQKGITLIELFAALATLAVVLSFASEPLQKMSARIEVDVAKDNVVETLRMARSAAARNKLPVNVKVTQDQGMIRLGAEFAQHRSSFRLENLPAYTLPENVTVSFPPEFEALTYPPVGDTRTSGTIKLSSLSNPDYIVEIRVANISN